MKSHAHVTPGIPDDVWTQLESGTDETRWQASMTLIKSPSPAAARRTAHIMRTAASARAREVAAWVLCSIGDDSPPVVTALLEALNDPYENIAVRAQAAEALGGHSRSKALGRRVARDLMDMLEHPSAELRFWAAFTLGAMRHRPALPALRKVAREDERVCPGWWYVAEEAEDAIASIEGRSHPARVPMAYRLGVQPSPSKD